MEVDVDRAELEPSEAAPEVPAWSPWSVPPPVSRHLDRELSWLDFNERVLVLAESRSVPLLERARFLAIFSRNLDEFFQIRVGGLKMQIEAGLGVVGDGEPATARLDRIGDRARELVARQNDIFEEQLAPELAGVGIHLSSLASLGEHEREVLDRSFEERIFPILTPLAVDPAHPFPYISNLSLNLAVVVRVPGELTRRIARVKVPPLLPRFVVCSGGQQFVPVEQVIASRLWELFPGMEVLEHHPFRVTRNADYEVDLDEAVDLRTAVESLLLQRRRSQTVVRLEVEQTMSDEVLGLLTKELRIDERAVYRVPGLLDLGGLWAITGLDRPELKYEPWTPVSPVRVTSTKTPPDLFAAIRERDLLVHHPYDSFETSVEGFIDQAASDPSVLAIKQTLYRTSGAESRLMEALIRAAHLGKQVVCVVELKARFDEEANIGWAQKLEEAGVHVVYGVVGLKTHAKLCLVVGEEQGAIRRYAHVGTGNYNPDTAHVYEDLGLFTADPEITMDVSDLFNLLTGYSRQREFRRLLVAPAGIRPGLLHLIEQESRDGGRIVMKANNLVDHEIIDALYAASAAAAEIDLVVRGACCLRPGVPGLSETIRVRSIVGRYLEHSRIYRFGEDDYYIGSADVMDRNLDRRVEALVPIASPELRARIDRVLDVLLADDVLAWQLQPDGTWRPPAGGDVDTHRTLERYALERAPRLTLA